MTAQMACPRRDVSGGPLNMPSMIAVRRPSTCDARTHAARARTVVRDLDADVPVQAGGDDAGDEREHVPDRLPRVLADAEVGERERVLALVRVDEEAIEEVGAEDERLPAHHPLPEVPRAPHLREDLGEDHRAAVGEDHVHDPVHLVRERAADEGRGRDRAARDVTAVRGDRGFVVGRRVRDEAHADEDEEEVEPDGAVREPAVVLQGPDLADEHADEGPDDDADREAELALCDLGERLAVGEADGADIDDELDRLEDAAEVAEPAAKDAAAEVGVRLDRVEVAVHLDEEVPEQEAGVARDDTHLRGVSLTRAAAKGNDGRRSRG
jgi:hypothetical protein